MHTSNLTNVNATIGIEIFKLDNQLLSNLQVTVLPINWTIP